MKRLLGEGFEKIFQISRCYRQGEKSRIHNTEFTMLEWYSTRLTFEDLIEETGLLLSKIFDLPKPDITDYESLFIKHTGFAASNINYDIFSRICTDLSLNPPDNFNLETEQETLLQFLLGMYIEPLLAPDKPLFVRDFPLSQAALAKTNPDGKTAARFEGYYKGIELCNGYNELVNRNDLELRLEHTNKQRTSAGKQAYKVDEFFLNTMKNGMPNCVGNALGVDRLIMLALNCHSISEVMSFTMENS